MWKDLGTGSRAFHPILMKAHPYPTPHPSSTHFSNNIVLLVVLFAITLQRSLARYWILPLILLALMLLMLSEFLIQPQWACTILTCIFFKGGGIPDSDWNAPPTDLPHISDNELHKFRTAIFREVAVTLEKEIGSFRSVLKTEMEAHVSKHVREVW